MRAAIWVGFTLTLLTGTAAAGKQPGWVEVDRVVAVVNQDVILASELTRRITGLSGGSGKPVPPEARKQMLDEMIDETLLSQEASRMHIEVSDQEVSGAIDEIKKQNQLDDAGLLKALADQGYTMDLYRQDVHAQILRIRAINVIIRPRIVIGDDEVQAAYKGAKTANPKIGALEAEKERLRQRLFEERMAVETRSWLNQRRQVSFIAVRGS